MFVPTLPPSLPHNLSLPRIIPQYKPQLLAFFEEVKDEEKELFGQYGEVLRYPVPKPDPGWGCWPTASPAEGLVLVLGTHLALRAVLAWGTIVGAPSVAPLKGLNLCTERLSRCVLVRRGQLGRTVALCTCDPLGAPLFPMED